MAHVSPPPIFPLSASGVFRATRMRLNPRQRAAHALFKTYIDVVHVDKEEGDKLFKQRTGAEVCMHTWLSLAGSLLACL